MTANEFNRWLAKHFAAFSSVAGWFGKLKPQEPDESPVPSQQRVLAAWYDVLRDVDLSDAEEATKIMSRGDEPEPRSYDAHPREIRGIVFKRRSSRLRDAIRTPPTREDRYCCLTCCDEGSVRIWNSLTMDSLANGEEPRDWTYAFARCQCQKGQDYAIKDERAGTYDPDRHCQAGSWQFVDGEIRFFDGDQQREQAREFANRPPVAVAFDPDQWHR